MTRTARATHPRAILKDRSESRSGYDKSVKKDGSGAHSWGNPLDDATYYTEEGDGLEEEAVTESVDNVSTRTVEQDASSATSSTSPAPTDDRRHLSSSSVSYTSEDIALAKEYRKGVFSGKEIDLAAIARSSPAVANPQNLPISVKGT